VNTFLGVAVDTSAHRLTRLEACRVILDEHLDPRNFYRRNGYNAERMLENVLPASATKYGGWNKPPVQVERPPMTLADVW
jgi:metallophosphoesterase superfamily enzyme